MSRSASLAADAVRRRRAREYLSREVDRGPLIFSGRDNGHFRDTRYLSALRGHVLPYLRHYSLARVRVYGAGHRQLADSASIRIPDSASHDREPHTKSSSASSHCGVGSAAAVIAIALAVKHL